MAKKNRMSSLDCVGERMILAITGSQGAGKSETLEKIARFLRDRSISLGGIISRSRIKSGCHEGYELFCVSNDVTARLAVPIISSEPEKETGIHFGRFRFYERALRIGHLAIARGMSSECLFIDEIGRWEMHGGGWSCHIEEIGKRTMPTILGIRQGIVPCLVQQWAMNIDAVFNLDTMSQSRLIEGVLQKLNRISIK